MGGHGRERLTKEEVEVFLERLDYPAARNECRACECLQGFVAQLKLDADEEAGLLLSARRVDAAQVHGCPDCEHCVPAEIFAEYLMRKRNA